MSGIHDKYAAVLAVIEQPKLDGFNPHYKSKYATLGECYRVVDAAIQATGDCTYRQESTYDALAETWVVSTRFMADGDDMLLASVPFKSVDDPQKQGSAITYARRYSLCTAFRLAADEDDDGNAASGSRQEPKQPRKKQAPKQKQKLPNPRNVQLQRMLKEMRDWCERNGLDFEDQKLIIKTRPDNDDSAEFYGAIADWYAEN